jgi:hypothetical protein
MAPPAAWMRPHRANFPVSEEQILAAAARLPRGGLIVTNLKVDNVQGPRVRALSQYLEMEKCTKVGIITKEGLPPKPRQGDGDRKDATTKAVGTTGTM